MTKDAGSTDFLAFLAFFEVEKLSSIILIAFRKNNGE